MLVHELTHALGFTDDMFDKFIDDSGQPIPKSQVGKFAVQGGATLQPRSQPHIHLAVTGGCFARVSGVGDCSIIIISSVFSLRC